MITFESSQMMPFEAQLDAVQIPLSPEAEQLRQRVLAPETARVYSSLWRDFAEWCVRNGCPVLPTQSNVVVNYLSTIPIQRSYSLVNSIVSAIKFKHLWHEVNIEGNQNTISMALEAFHKSYARVVRKAPEIDLELLEKVCASLPDTLLGLRDRAMFLLTFYAGFRRCEVVSLKSEHVRALPCGNIEIVLLQSKTSDQPVTLHVARNSNSADGRLCPVRTIEEWRNRTGITEGPLIRPAAKGKLGSVHLAANSFNQAIKRMFGAQYSGHSFRRGLATEMNDCGMPLSQIATQLRHADTKTTFGYIENATGIAAAEDIQQAFARKRKE